MLTGRPAFSDRMFRHAPCDAREQGAEVVKFDEEDLVETFKSLTGGISVDPAIDAVGIDPMHAHAGPAAAQADDQ
jgi:NADPH:quinone reductase-like Zn-dependent oxidoreductase